ncbi:MAG: DUF1622 domain-containing protein [Pseudoxanthomonas sp.]|nr:DUF1622 domain-containing protein [Pseudoxanthomonas sp.]
MVGLCALAGGRPDFQFAADIIESSVAPSWEVIGQLGAIAVIRTFLDYFLGRDVAGIHQRERESLHPPR